MRKAVCAAFINNKEVLLVKKKNVWIFPGGKPQEKDKNHIATLLREVGEELPNLRVDEESLIYFDNFQGITPHEKDALSAKVFIGKATGNIKPANEINDSGWFSAPNDLNLSDITRKIILDLEHQKKL